MVLPLYATLEKMDETLLEAAADLGCPPLEGVLAGDGAAVAAGRDGRRAALLHPDRRRVRHPRPARRLATADDRADAVDSNSSPTATGRSPPRSRSCCCCCLLVVPIVIYQHCRRAISRRALTDARPASGSTSTRSRSGLAFLYLPIAILVIYSFNASRLVTVWGGWSTRWYRALLNDRRCSKRPGYAAHRLPLGDRGDGARHARGARAGARFGRFRGRLLFSGMIYAPLVMPEVITGLVAAAAVRRGRDRPRLLDHGDRAHHADHVLRHRGGAVAARRPSTAASRRRRWISAARRCAPS